MKPFERSLAILLNPSSGGGRAKSQRRRLEKILRKQGIHYDLLETENEDHLRQLLPQVASTYTAVAIAGGDSSFFIAINEWMRLQLQVPLAFLGLGSCNDLARELAQTDLRAVCRAIKRMRPRRIDLGELHAEGKRIAWFPGQLSLGLGVQVNRAIAASGQDGALASRSQVLAGIRATHKVLRNGNHPLHLQISADDQDLSGDYALALFSNIRYYASGMKILPRARPDDGKLDALLVPPASFGRLLGLGIRAWLGHAPAASAATWRQAACFRIAAKTPFAVQIDGEIPRRGDGQADEPRLFCEIEIRTQPAALPIFA